MTTGGVDTNAKNYAKEFIYTEKHVSHYYNTMYSILLYKDMKCIEELSINMPKIDFGKCYEKVLDSIVPKINGNLIVGLFERGKGQNKPSISYFFYHPETGEKIDADTICKDEEIEIKESVLNQLNNSDVDLNSILYLANQDINIFNLSDAFYTDICYHFDSPNGKDAPLGDRIKSFYPNITLCDTGCTSKGVNLTTMESICTWKFNDIMSNDLIEGNALIQSTLGGITDLVNNSNIMVLKCYKNVFKKENIKKGIGGYLILIILFFEIVFSLLFLINDMPKIRRYLYNLTEQFMNYISQNKQNESINNPPKKGKKRKGTLKALVENVNNINENNKKDLIQNDKYSKSISAFKSESNLTQKKAIPHKNKLKKKKRRFRIHKKDLSALDVKTQKINMDSGNIDIEEYLKPDLDDLEYDDAIKLDKREFGTYFTEKLMEKQTIMDTFYNKENLRPMPIKIILLLLNIDLYFVVNALFFNEEYLSELYNSEEEETFFSYIPRSISRFFYAFLVGYIVGIIMDCIFIEESKIRRTFLREQDDPVVLRYEIAQNSKSIQKRYTIFIFLCIFISIISWYYISCFNNTYPCVRKEWIKSSITIIIIMQILSLLNILLQAILRSLSFRCKSEKLYKIKQIIA